MRDGGDCLFDESWLRQPARELAAIWPRSVGFDQHPIGWEHSRQFLVALTISDFGRERDEVAGVDYCARRLLVGFVPVKNRAANFRGADYFERLDGASMRRVENQREIQFSRDTSELREPHVRLCIDIGVCCAHAVPWQPD